MNTLRDKIIEQHIKEYYPNAKIVRYDDEDCDFTFYNGDELKNVDEDWFPLCCYKDPKTGKAIYGGRKGVYHTYTEGETGAGKTTRFVMQSIYALSSMKNKPSFIVVDIHGEIVENLYKHFKENGYKILIINCDNPERSDTYDPFAKDKKESLETGTVSNETENNIRRISEIIQPIESDSDPIWDRGARAYTHGAIRDKFEDLINGDLPADCLTLYNVIQNHYWLRKKFAGVSSYGNNDLLSIPHYEKKGSGALSVQKMLAVTNNAEKTRASYFGVVENHYDSFGQPALYKLSSSSSVDADGIIDRPTAVFIQSGNTKIGDDLISLLMNDIYTTVVKRGKASKTKKLPRNIHCFLDEFANCNIADGPEYIKMLTTSRKFGMFWHMMLQCDAQLDRKFDADIGRIIRANCTELFMGSHDYNTMVRFAKSCGQQTIESLASRMEQQHPHFEVTELITPDILNLTENGYIYVKSNRHPLTKTYIEAFYNCDEFEAVDNIDSVYPHNDFDYQKTLFFPDDIPDPITSSEFKVLSFLNTMPRTLDDLTVHFPDVDIKKLLKEMALQELIVLMDNRTVKTNVSEREFRLHEHRAKYKVSAGCNEKLFAPTDEDDDLPFDGKPMPILKTPSEIERWLYGYNETANSIFEDLQIHLGRGKSVEALQKIASLKIIPDFLTEALRYLSSTKSQQKRKPIDFVENFHCFKVEILEAFIKNNNFHTKERWLRKMKEEYSYLKAENIFPKSITTIFEEAVNELSQLSLEEIREIKSILSD